jgi:L-threonine kinase
MRLTDSAPTAPVGVGSAPGTCGELVQGVLREHAFMITFPVDIRTMAYVTASPLPGVSVWPPHKEKARLGIEKMRSRLGFSRLDLSDVRVSLASPIPEGKGFASSSADIVAACRAYADYLGVAVSDEELCTVAAEIEPTDAVMFEHPIVFDFQTGRVLHDPGKRLRVLAVVIDVGGTLRTIEFVRVPYTSRERSMLETAHGLALRGLAEGDLATLGEAATISARVNQRRHHKPRLERLIALAHAYGGHGVSVAHTGTVVALLFDETELDGARNAAAAVAELLPAAVLSCVRGA